MEREEQILFKCLKKRIHDKDETECQKDQKKGMEREEREHIVLMFLKNRMNDEDETDRQKDFAKDGA